MVQLYGWNLVETVIENTVFVPKSRMLYTQLSRGEMPSGVTEECQPFLEAPVYLEEGTGTRFGAVAIIKGGPNPGNACLFVDFHNSAEGHAIGVKVRQRCSPRSDVDPPEGIGMPATSEGKFFPDGAGAAENRQTNLLRRAVQWQALRSKR